MTRIMLIHNPVPPCCIGLVDVDGVGLRSVAPRSRLGDQVTKLLPALKLVKPSARMTPLPPRVYAVAVNSKLSPCTYRAHMVNMR